MKDEGLSEDPLIEELLEIASIGAPLGDPSIALPSKLS